MKFTKKKDNSRKRFFSFTKGKIILCSIILILLMPILIEIFYTAIYCELYNQNIDDIKCSTMVDNLNIFNINQFLFIILIILIIIILSYLFSCVLLLIYNKLRQLK